MTSSFYHPPAGNFERQLKKINQALERLKLKQHPDKTFIGRAEKGFDFLGYQFGEARLTVSVRSQQNYLRRYTQLYEQKKRQRSSQKERLACLERYRQRWATWVTAGLPPLILNPNFANSLRDFTRASAAQPETQKT